MYIRVPLSGHAELFRRESGTWVEKFQIGGNALLSGSGVPADAIGRDGDYYIRTPAAPTPPSLYIKSSGVVGYLLFVGSSASGSVSVPARRLARWATLGTCI